MPSSLIPSSGRGKKGPPPPMDFSKGDEKKGGQNELLSVKNALPLIVSLVVVAGAYGAVAAWGQLTQRSIQGVQSSQAEVREAFENAEIQEARIFAEKAEGASVLLEEQMEPSYAFAFVEDSMHDGVRLYSLVFDTNNSFVSVEALATSTADFAEQYLIWRDDDSVQHIEITDFTVQEGGEVSFTAVLDVSSDVFNEPVEEDEEEDEEELEES